VRQRSALIGAVALLAIACGGNIASRAHKTLGVALSAANAARDSFTAWDKDHQLEIVHNATTREEAEAKIATYRHTRADVLAGFTVAYTSIAAAAAVIPLVEQGQRQELDLLGLIATAAQATADIEKAVKALRGAVP
jgi:hypothetical protein